MSAGFNIGNLCASCSLLVEYWYSFSIHWRIAKRVKVFFLARKIVEQAKLSMYRFSFNFCALFFIMYCLIFWNDLWQAITSCNSTKDELIAEVNRFNRLQKSNSCNGKDDKDDKQANGPDLGSTEPMLEYIDHVRTYPTFRFGGVEGSRVSTVAFILRD